MPLWRGPCSAVRILDLLRKRSTACRTDTPRRIQVNSVFFFWSEGAANLKPVARGCTLPQAHRVRDYIQNQRNASTSLAATWETSTIGPRPPRKGEERLAASARTNLQWMQTASSRLDAADDVDQRADVGDGDRGNCASLRRPRPRGRRASATGRSSRSPAPRPARGP